MRSAMFNAVLNAIPAEASYAARLEAFRDGSYSTSLHLAVLVEPYLGFVLDGTKTIESRFSSLPIAPYGQISAGDTILLKPPSQPICGICTVLESWQYTLTNASREFVRNQFGPALAAQPGFWESKAKARYATLVAIGDVETTDPIPVPKRDRRGWVVLASAERQLGWDI